MKPQPLAKGLFATPKPEVRSVTAPRPGFEVMLQVAAAAQSLGNSPLLRPTTEPVVLARQADPQPTPRLTPMVAPTKLLQWPPPSANTSTPVVRTPPPAQRANDTDTILLTPTRQRVTSAPPTPPDAPVVARLRTVVASSRFTPLAGQRPPLTWSAPSSASVPAVGGVTVPSTSLLPSRPSPAPVLAKLQRASNDATQPASSPPTHRAVRASLPTTAPAPAAPRPATGGAITTAVVSAAAAPQLASAPRPLVVQQAAVALQPAVAHQPAVAPLTPQADPSPLLQRPARVAERRAASEQPSLGAQVMVSALGASAQQVVPTLPPQPQPDAPPTRIAAAPRTAPALVSSSRARPTARQPNDDRDERPLLRRAPTSESTMFAQRAPDAVAATAAAKPFDTKLAPTKADTARPITAPTPQLNAALLPKSPMTPRAAAPQQLDAIATRAKAQHEVQRVSTTSAATVHAPKHAAVQEPEPVAPERRKGRDELKPETLAAPIAAPPPPTPVAEQPTLVTAPPPVLSPVLEPMLTQVAEDPSLRISLMPMVARVSLETPDAGRVSLQLKVADGVTDVRATGPAAASLELRQNELRVALAHEGLALGNFDLTQSQHQHQRPERPEAELPRAPRPTVSSTDSVDDDGRLHVKA